MNINRESESERERGECRTEAKLVGVRMVHDVIEHPGREGHVRSSLTNQKKSIE